MHRSLTIVVTAAIASAALAACSGGKSSSTTTTTTTTQSSPAASAAASPAATAAAMKSTTMKTTSRTKTTTSVAMSSAASMQAGSKVYTTNCSSCHQANGKGQPGVFPPLAGNPTVQGPAADVIHIVKNGKNGKITVNGTSYNGQMPAWKGTLSDSDIAAVITYIRGSWGNHASAVTAAQVTATK
jgi:mono/diheme cytochrome c family protein